MAATNEASAQMDGAIVTSADAAAAAPVAVESASGNSVPASAAASSAAAAHEAKRFLLKHKEKLQMNQYWYSLPTIAAMVTESEREATRGCFLSTPSIFFSLNDKKLRANSKVFDYDEMWSQDPGFVKYDYKKVEDIPKEMYHTFDFIVIDPPFITAEVWAEYAKAAKLLLVEGVQDVEIDAVLADQYYSSMMRAYTAGVSSLKGEVVGTSFAGNIASMLSNVLGGGSSQPSAASAASASSLQPPSAPRPSPSGDESKRLVSVPRGKLLLSTIPEHEGYLYVLLGCAQPRFRPSIPNLIYQYSFYANYPAGPLMQLNPEIDDEPPQTKFTSKKKSSIPL